MKPSEIVWAIVVVATLIALLMWAAYADDRCGFRPAAPIGCHGAPPLCVCDEDGHCRWQFVDCQ
jgi:hypothetical protein